MRIIDADELLLQTGYFDDYDGFVTEYVLAKDVRKAPTIEAKPVVHGEWVMRYTAYACSLCGVGAPSPFWNYCPYCGADMRERIEI
jgi:hypothetical protein